MNIKIGEYYVNKTWRFLMPCLRGHGDEFVRKFNPLYKLGVGIFDSYAQGQPWTKGNNIYIMIDKLYQPKQVNDFLDWVRTQSYYKFDYCPDADVLSSRKHMVVIEIPNMFNDAYNHFLQSSYSTMYLENDIKLLFSNVERQPEAKVLRRDSSILDDYIKKVNEKFGTTLVKSDFQMSEYEFPLENKEEIFNYSGNNVFFCVETDLVWQLK